jgi:hypothetical protein
MKKIFLLLILLSTYFFHASAQVVTSDPSDYTNPNQEVKIIVNLDQLDQTIEHVQLLIADADSSKDLFIWTWKPFEHPAGHPLVNGIGAQPWKNSNDTLKMTKESDHVYSYTMIPTEFYGVDAAAVFTEDIHFLVKPKDGGGYGDPDRKSTDLVFEINPPSVEKEVVYSFPSKILQDDFIRIVYDNYRDTLAAMQNIIAGECYVHLKALLSDGTIVQPSPYFSAGDNPDLEMKNLGAGIFEKTIIPEIFFGLQDGQKIDRLTAIVFKKAPIYIRVEKDLVVDMSCWN